MKLTRKIQEKHEPEAKCNLQSDQRFETGMKSNWSGFVFPFKLFPRELTAKSHCTINSPNDEITIVHSFTLLEQRGSFLRQRQLSTVISERAETCNRCSPHLADFLVQDTEFCKWVQIFHRLQSFRKFSHTDDCFHSRAILYLQVLEIWSKNKECQSPSIQNKPLCELYVGLRKHKVAACFSLPQYIPSSSPPIFYTQKYLNLQWCF